MRAQAVHQLGFIGDNDQAAAGAGHHLFAQQCPAAALDQIERPTLDFVRAIDGQVQLRVIGQGRNRDAQPARLSARMLRGRDANDVQSLLDALAQCVHRQSGGRPGSQADHHPVFYQRHRGFRRCLLEFFKWIHLDPQ